MYKDYLEDFIIDENESVYKACWQYQRNKEALLLVVDANKKFKGIIGSQEIRRSFLDGGEVKVKDICNSNGKRIICKDGEDFYAEGRIIFEENEIFYLPVVDEETILLIYFQENVPFLSGHTGLAS